MSGRRIDWAAARHEVADLVRFCWCRPETSLARWSALAVIAGAPLLLVLAAQANRRERGAARDAHRLGRWERAWSARDVLAPDRQART